MSSRRWGIFIAFFTTGLFYGILVSTGYDLFPNALAVAVGDQVLGVFPHTTANDVWEVLRILIPVASVLSTVFLVVTVLRKGRKYIVSAVCGFLSGLALLISIPIFAVFLVGGWVWSKYG